MATEDRTEYHAALRKLAAAAEAFAQAGIELVHVTPPAAVDEVSLGCAGEVTQSMAKLRAAGFVEMWQRFDAGSEI